MNEGKQKLLEFMISADRNSALEYIQQILENGVSHQTIINDILDPALVSIGKLWGKEQVSLSQTFVAAKIAESILIQCSDQQSASEKEKKGVTVIGNIEDDFHGLGRRIVKSFLEASGWEVIDLGSDVLAEDFIEKALEAQASVIGVSAMMQSSALNIKKIRKLLDERGLSAQLKLAVGGAVFNWRESLIEEVGADGSCANAAEADVLFTNLQASAEEPS